MKQLLTILFFISGLVSANAQFFTPIKTPIAYDNIRINKFYPPSDTFPVTLADTGRWAIVGKKQFKVFNVGGVAKWDTLAGGGSGGVAEIFPGLGIIQSAPGAIRTNNAFVSSKSLLPSVISPSSSVLYRTQLGSMASTITQRDYRYDATSTATTDGVMVVNGPGGVGRFFMIYDDYVDPVWFGAIPNDDISDNAACQAASNFAISSTRVKRVRFGTIGVYNVDSWVLANYVSGSAQPFSLTVEGAMVSDFNGVILKNTNVNAATIHIQLGLGVDINNIIFQGISPAIGNTGALNYITATDADWRATTSGTIRGNHVSPGQVAVSIDPFYKIGAFGSTIASSTDYYPGLSSYYSSESYGGSTNINVNQCNVVQMYAFVTEGLSGVSNGENVHVNGGKGVFVTYTWIAGQLQSRQNTINKFYLIFGHTFVINRGWGTGVGDVPAVNDCNINYLKQAFDTYGEQTSPRYIGGYQEGMHTMGRHEGASAVVYENVQYTDASTLVTGVRTAKSPVLLESSGPVSIKGGAIQSDAYFQGFAFNAPSVKIDGTRIRSGTLFQSNETRFDKIEYINASWSQGGAGPRQLSDFVYNESSEAEDAILNGYYLLPGSRYKGRDKVTVENIGNKLDRIPLGVHAVTVDASSNTLTFTNTSGAVLEGGDVIYSQTPVDWSGDIYSATGTTLGYVTNIVGTTVTLADVPYGVVNSGSYDMQIARMPKYIPHTIGTVTAGSTNISNLLFNGSTFAYGDRVKGIGIPVGAYCVGVSSNSMLISVPATANGDRVELYDAKIRQTATNETLNYFGLTNYFDINKVWFRGDIIENKTGALDNGGEFKSYYFTRPGKMTSATPPELTTGSLKTGFNGSGTSIAAGTLGFQSVLTNNDFVFSNLYFDGAAIRYKESGPGSYMRFLNGGMIYVVYPAGLAGAIATGGVERMFVDGTTGKIRASNLAGIDSSQVGTDVDGNLVRIKTTDSIVYQNKGDGAKFVKDVVGDTVRFKTLKVPGATVTENPNDVTVDLSGILAGCSTCVQLTGDQTIAGNKTLTGTTTLDNLYGSNIIMSGGLINNNPFPNYSIYAPGGGKFYNLGYGEFGGRLKVKRIGGDNDNPPSIAAGSGAGSSPSVTLASGATDVSGRIHITTGSSPSGSATVATITFNTAYDYFPSAIVLIPSNEAAFGLKVWAEAGSAGTILIKVGSSALPASTGLSFTYVVTQ